ncbi:hypothetical protein [Sulfolobus acidocaldarius]|uniref:Succinate dehydrogenase subunit D n=4 Tax=Sulfolobus acidocaldarius TaxID=2285 RepID=Q4JA40_SULAC|nr:hypothetical protein [Sulfolobus acidocaldarius]AAY80340.1 succinate dehydrogenase subunit D [Sulfolobus acidocaldarius DSM 639]AGE70921.1 succinate dehydrogenase subunit D [Sulfolobus acidocaldarius N8]AGE73192.1 succinate dehydrogenase subunit D [Sulfolobus acidocaldarius Ron12/I]ALU28773.1 succinate dehydrogenase [Sulfolobus acidocaldarius]ALU31493.1 succinate dehydrogenase [Sulfolobus acidocaldarius]
MSVEENISNVITKIGGDVKRNWYPVSERPGKEPFAKEIEYTVGDLYSGKIHLRNEGDIYVFVVSKYVFNWKEKTKDLKIKGELIDAAGGLMWIKEENEKSLEEDMKFLRDYVNSAKSSSSQH